MKSLAAKRTNARWRADPPRADHRSCRAFSGRLVPEKGLDALAAALRRLGPAVALVVAGTDRGRRGSNQRTWGRRLRIVPGADHANRTSVYAEADVLVLPSRTTSGWAEQFGGVLGGRCGAVHR